MNYRCALAPAIKPLQDQLFREESEAGRILQEDAKPLTLQAVRAVPKKNSVTPRPIFDCRRPAYCSLISYIEPAPFSFDSIDNVVTLSSFECYFSVVDIKAAYRWVPVFPAHHNCKVFAELLTELMRTFLLMRFCLWSGKCNFKFLAYF